MKKYVVVIEETCAQEFEVIADNAEEALKIARKSYKKGEFVLEPGECQHRQIAVSLPNEEITEWEEF